MPGRGVDLAVGQHGRGLNLDVVLVGIGDVVTTEIMAAASILRKELPVMRVRVVNVTDLLILERNTEHPHGLDDDMFHALFTADCPVIVNFHGYPSVVAQLLYGRGTDRHWTINGYREEGTTTTPFDMLVRNGASRYHLIQQAIRAAERISYYEYVLREFRARIEQTGDDPEEITGWQWS